MSDKVTREFSITKNSLALGIAILLTNEPFADITIEEDFGEFWVDIYEDILSDDDIAVLHKAGWENIRGAKEWYYNKFKDL